jgi:hypothetical protein
VGGAPALRLAVRVENHYDTAAELVTVVGTGPASTHVEAWPGPCSNVKSSAP